MQLAALQTRPELIAPMSVKTLTPVLVLISFMRLDFAVCLSISVRDDGAFTNAILYPHQCITKLETTLGN